MIIMVPSFSKRVRFQIAFRPPDEYEKPMLSKLLRFEGRFRKAPFSDHGLVATEGLAVELKLLFSNISGFSSVDAV